MSAVSYEKLYRWKPEEDEAGPVSAVPECANVMATRCRLDGDDVIYESDIPLVVRRGVAFRMGQGGFSAIVAEPQDPAYSAALAGQEFVMATWPLSRGWFDHGTFQYGSKHKARPPGREIEEAFRQNPRVLRDLLQDLRRNPFDSRHYTVTAMLFDPFLLDPLKKYILGRQCHYKGLGGAGTSQNDAKPQPMQLMSICKDFEVLRNKLLVDKMLLDMVDATCVGRNLFQRYRPHPVRGATSHGTDGSPSYLIFQEIATTELAWQIMRTSVDLALAGPESFEEFRENLDAQQDPDGRKLVKHRVRDIYVDIYLNLWKRINTIHRTEKKSPASRRGGPADNPEEEFWRAVDAAGEDLDLTLGSIDSICKKVLANFDAAERVPEKLCGPNHQEPPPGSGYDAQSSAITLFLLQAAAVIKAGHDSRRLCLALDELEEQEAAVVRVRIGWIKAKFAARWDRSVKAQRDQ